MILPDFSGEFIFNASKSSGPGGQHVNKTNTKVELRFDVINSQILNDEEKKRIIDKLKSKINSEGFLIVVSDRFRSQSENKEETIRKFNNLIIKALTPVKKRKPTTPTKASKEKRMEDKKKQSVRKFLRAKPEAE